jgi:hypothetical protein
MSGIAAFALVAVIGARAAVAAPVAPAFVRARRSNRLQRHLLSRRLVVVLAKLKVHKIHHEPHNRHLGRDMKERNLLEDLVAVSPGMEIWWDSSPVIFANWCTKMLA